MGWVGAHPRLVGQVSTSRARRSMFAQESAAHRRGATCVHGMALGSPAARCIFKGLNFRSPWSAWCFAQESTNFVSQWWCACEAGIACASVGCLTPHARVVQKGLYRLLLYPSIL